MNETELSLSVNNPTSNSTTDESINLNITQRDNNNTKALYGNPYYILYPKRIGNHYAFCYIGTYPLITIGPDSKHNTLYNLFIVLTGLILPLIVTLIYSPIGHFCIKYLPYGLRLSSHISFASQIISNALVLIINPGIPSRSYYNFPKKNNNDLSSSHKGTAASSSNDNVVICKECNLRLPCNIRVVHCEECNVCIIGFDHHCPWTSKCIGRNNIFFFYLFLFTTVMYFITMFLVLFAFLLVCLAVEQKAHKTL